MEVRKAEAWEKPRPRPDELEAHFYRAAARGELLFQRCPGCGHAQFYPRPLCTACGGDPEWATACGRGTVHTFSIVRQNFAAGFREEVPYAVAMVELEEGVQMMGNITDCELERVRIGLPVEAWALEIDDDLAIPFWRPASGS
jgi:uncharacterized OB-fold protein